MNAYPQVSQRISWALISVTLLLAFLVSVALGFVSVVVGFVQHWMVPEKPWRFGYALGFAGVVLLSALWLARFYFIVARGRCSLRHERLGWLFSTCYHAAMTWLFLMSGTVLASDGIVAFKIPFFLISGAAFCASIYLFVRGR